MDTKQKMAIVGSSLIVTGVGLGLVGAALLVPAAFEWTARSVEKGADGFTAKVERASRTVGAVAGTLHRSFSDAKKAGLGEIQRTRSSERSIAG
jgi:hypothetical protein